MIRLLRQEDDRSFKFYEFNDVSGNTPAYAILSHTWADGPAMEVEFKDLEAGIAAGKPGYVKLEFCAYQAAEDALQYFWIDTACINKRDPVEHSEAIRSMYLFYQMAARCYVYMSDVSSSTAYREWKQEFKSSRWFTRGWTLQELLAPRHVHFYSYEIDRQGKGWRWLGSKKSLARQIHEVTRIPMQALRASDISQYSLDTRLSWAEGRETTREEDKSYCLLSFLDIHMPILYGEGEEAAWRRLQDEIKRTKAQDTEDGPIVKTTQSDYASYLEHQKAIRTGGVASFARNRQSTSRLQTATSFFYYLIIALAAASIMALWHNSTSAQTSLVVSPTNPQKLDRSLPIFAIIGRTGAGKSTFIDTIGGLKHESEQPPEVCHGLRSCTRNLTIYKFRFMINEEDSSAYIIDTPGIDDEGHSDLDIMSAVFETLKSLSFEDRLIRGLIYLYDISQPRTGDLTYEHMRLFETICGPNKFKSVSLVTTKWLANPTQEESKREILRERELQNIYWKEMLDVGSRMWRYDGSQMTALIIIASLLYQPDIKLNLEQDWFYEKTAITRATLGRSQRDEDFHNGLLRSTNDIHHTPLPKARRVQLGWKLYGTLMRLVCVSWLVLGAIGATARRNEDMASGSAWWYPYIIYVGVGISLFALLISSVLLSWFSALSPLLLSILILAGGPRYHAESLMAGGLLLITLANIYSFYQLWPVDRSTYYL